MNSRLHKRIDVSLNRTLKYQLLALTYVDAAAAKIRCCRNRSENLIVSYGARPVLMTYCKIRHDVDDVDRSSSPSHNHHNN